MKLDYDLLTEVLKHVEENGDGETRQRLTPNNVSETGLTAERFPAFGYHFDLLASGGFIDGKAERLHYRGDKLIVELYYFGLTLEGHALLDSMRNEGVWKRIASTAKTLGVEGLKQIPALAVALLSQD